MNNERREKTKQGTSKRRTRKKLVKFLRRSTEMLDTTFMIPKEKSKQEQIKALKK